MQKCENCNIQFRWSEIYKSIWKSYKPIKCEKCDTTHKIIASSRWFFSFFSILPMLILGYSLAPFYNVFVTLSTAIIVCIIGSLAVPFLVTYKAEKIICNNVPKWHFGDYITQMHPKHRLSAFFPNSVVQFFYFKAI